MATSRSSKSGSRAAPAKRGKVRFVKSISEEAAQKAAQKKAARRKSHVKATSSTTPAARPKGRAAAPHKKASTKRARAVSSRKAPTRSSRAREEASAPLPGWKDLVDSNDRVSSPEPDSTSFLAAIPTVRFILGVLAVACLFTLYVGHVYATQDLLSEVQGLRKENLNLHLDRNRVTGEFGRKTSPAYIYSRAAELNLTERVPEGATISVP